MGADASYLRQLGGIDYSSIVSRSGGRTK